MVVQTRLQEAGRGCDLWRDGVSDQPATGAGLRVGALEEAPLRGLLWCPGEAFSCLN